MSSSSLPPSISLLSISLLVIVEEFLCADRDFITISTFQAWHLECLGEHRHYAISAFDGSIKFHKNSSQYMQ